MQEIIETPNPIKGRKVFISFLGTGNYVPVTYYFKQEEKPESNLHKYIQAALLEKLANEDFKDEEVTAYIFCTPRSIENNWNASEAIAPSTDEHDDNKRLEEVLEDRSYSNWVQMVPLENDNGGSVWEIFSKVESKIQQGDELYFDITHAFRSQPMIMMALINYLKVTKNAKLNQIYYGAFETLGTPPEVKEMPEEKRFAEIILLNDLDKIQETAGLIDDFVKYLKFDTTKIPVRELHSSQLQANISIEKLGKLDFISELNHLSLLISLCRGKSLYKYNWDKFKEWLSIKQAPVSGSAQLDKLYEKIYSHLAEKIQFLSTGSRLNFIYLSEWCFQSKLYQQAVTQLIEGVITYFIIKYFPSKCQVNQKLRGDVGAAFQYYHVKAYNQKALAKNKPINNSPIRFENEDFYNKLINDTELVAIAYPYHNFSDIIRNDINHAGYRTTIITETQFCDYIASMIKLLKTQLSA